MALEKEEEEEEEEEKKTKTTRKAGKLKGKQQPELTNDSFQKPPLLTQKLHKTQSTTGSEMNLNGHEASPLIHYRLYMIPRDRVRLFLGYDDR